MGIVCHKTDAADRAHSASPFSGADVRGGIVGPCGYIEATESQDRIPYVPKKNDVLSSWVALARGVR